MYLSWLSSLFPTEQNKQYGCKSIGWETQHKCAVVVCEPSPLYSWRVWPNVQWWQYAKEVAPCVMHCSHRRSNQVPLFVPTFFLLCFCILQSMWPSSSIVILLSFTITDAFCLFSSGTIITDAHFWVPLETYRSLFLFASPQFVLLPTFPSNQASIILIAICSFLSQPSLDFTPSSFIYSTITDCPLLLILHYHWDPLPPLPIISNAYWLISSCFTFTD